MRTASMDWRPRLWIHGLRGVKSVFPADGGTAPPPPPHPSRDAAAALGLRTGRRDAASRRVAPGQDSLNAPRGTDPLIAVEFNETAYRLTPLSAGKLPKTAAR